MQEDWCLENEWEATRRDEGCSRMKHQPIGSEQSGDHVDQELCAAEQNDLSAILGGTVDKDTPEELRLEE
jgi:hypothetical protein